MYQRCEGETIHLSPHFIAKTQAYSPGKDILEFSVVGVTKSKLAARSLYEPARCFGVNIDPVFPNSVFEYRRILVAERGLKWKARLAGGSGGILHSYES
ncbi:hypothetical protein J6590_077189 [Homalodisca vitripennis]|nr:hypothetical protein J6590_077189 [Homalodisca vitripennis]